MMFLVTTIEVDREGLLMTIHRPALARSTLAATVRIINRLGIVPGNISGTGLTIVETQIQSAP